MASLSRLCGVLVCPSPRVNTQTYVIYLRYFDLYWLGF